MKSCSDSRQLCHFRNLLEINMQAPDLHPQESARLKSLNELNILDTESEEIFDEIVQLASMLCGAPISLVSLIDEDRQWFKARHGLAATETSRDYAFCGHAILQDDVFVVENPEDDKRFKDNPLVKDGPQIRFYAGAVLKDEDNLPMGTLCVIDDQKREFSEEQKKALKILAKQAESQLTIRRQNVQLQKTNKLAQDILSLVAHDLKGAFTVVLGSSTLMTRKLVKLQQQADVMKIGNRIVAAASDVYELLDELLQWTRLQFTDDQVMLKEHDIDDLIASTLKVFDENAKAKNVRLISGQKGGVSVLVNDGVTKTILRNLLSNSIKHTPEGKSVSVSVEVVNCEAIISVFDEGPGVPETMKPHLLKATQQAIDGDYESPPSHGVGLYLCNAIAQRQKSRIWLDESVTEGCRMCIALPLSQY